MEERLLASKILLVGDKAAGKSSLARVFAGKAFTESYHPTTTGMFSFTEERNHDMHVCMLNNLNL
jgi:GTPase SAR1 family protein